MTVCFNPRPHEEGDVSPATATLSKGGFNPRPREEGDVSEDEPLFDDRDFNPRPREEGDKSFPKWMLSALQFQSTPS